MGVLSDLQPAAVFHFFEEICGIPHGSSHTKEISDHLVMFAKERNLKWIQDPSNNVVIWKPGTQGYEDSAPVMLQGHMDMVCEKDADCDIDFEKDGLRLKIENGAVSAQGTTLGGDDGIAIAYALAVLDSENIPHPPLEAVFTVDEEIGMLGAAALDCGKLSSRIMLNIDSEEEGHLLVSCAGGVTVEGHLPIDWEMCRGILLNLTVTGLRGGHSGMEIDKGRGNACQLLGRALYQLRQSCSCQLISIGGGMKDNAIPREATARLIVESSCADDWESLIRQLGEIYAAEYRLTDPDIRLTATAGDRTIEKKVMTVQSTERVIAALVNLPGGIQKMSFDIKGLVQTSLNLGTVKTKEEEVIFSFGIRSNVGTEKEELVSRIQCLMESFGGTIMSSGDYPAWEYREDSPLRDLMIQVFEEQYGQKPVIEAIHAGLECGLFAGKLPGLDCVSFGPDMDGIHTPKESMDVDSVKRVWEYILEVLKRLR